VKFAASWYSRRKLAVMTRQVSCAIVSAAMSATELRHRIRLLELALASAEDTGLTAYEPYRRQLVEELAACRTAFVEAAVIEIAVLRSAISGRNCG
jgi:hypothetical protein